MTDFTIIQAPLNEFSVALNLLKIAASRLQEKGLEQWDYWLNPPEERLLWAQNGFDNQEFYFLKIQTQTIGMYRLMTEDLLYWGKQETTTYYIHSLVIIPEFKGNNLGAQIIDNVYQLALKNGMSYLRLDCNASNPALCHYYEKLGFKKVGTKLMAHSLNCLYEIKVTT